MSGGHLEGVWIVYKGCLWRFCVSVCVLCMSEVKYVCLGVGCIGGYKDLKTDNIQKCCRGHLESF